MQKLRIAWLLIFGGYLSGADAPFVARYALHAHALGHKKKGPVGPCFFVVEARRVELLSEIISSKASPGAVSD